MHTDNEIVYSNRRVGSRKAVVFECDVRTERGVRIAWQASDISVSGLYLHTSCFVANAIPVGTRVQVQFQLPRSRTTIKVKGEIARYVHANRWNESTCGVGVRFKDLPFHDATYLSERLKQTPPPVPLRKPRPDYASMIFNLATGKRPIWG